MEFSKEMQVEITGEHPIGVNSFYALLEFPTTKGLIEDAKHRARWDKGDEVYKEFNIIYCDRFPEIEDLRLDKTTLEELNYFTRLLAELPEEDIYKFWGVFNYLCNEKHFADEPVSVKDLINITYGLDSVMIVSNIDDDEKLGQFVIENDMNSDISDIPDKALYLIDKAHIGELQRKNEGGVFVQDSYVVAGNFEMPNVYDGVNIPDNDENAVFRLKVVSADYENPEDADAIAEWISLPMSEEEANRFVNEKFGAPSIEDCVYFGFESSIPQITDNVFEVMSEYGMLNEIAKRYQAMSPNDQIKYKAMLEGETVECIGDALRLTEYMNDYELAADCYDSTSFFKNYLLHHMDTHLDSKWIDGAVNTNEANHLMKQLGAVKTGYGILSCRNGHLFDLVPYDGDVEMKVSKAQIMTDQKFEVVEVLGQTALYSNSRVVMPLPDGVYKYDLRGGESQPFATVEPFVKIDYVGTLIMAEQLDFSEKGYIEFDEDSAPNFSGEESTIDEFAEEYADIQEETAQQFGGM